MVTSCFTALIFKGRGQGGIATTEMKKKSPRSTFTGRTRQRAKEHVVRTNGGHLNKQTQPPHPM